MSDYLPPLADISLEEAQQIRGALLRAITAGSLTVRYADGTSVTYRSMGEMQISMAEIEGRIAAATAPIGTSAPTPLRAFVMRPWNGYY